MVGIFSVDAYVGFAGCGVCEFFYGGNVDVACIGYLDAGLAYLLGDGVVVG